MNTLRRMAIGVAAALAALVALPLHAQVEPVMLRIGHAAPTSGWLARVGIENENAARLAVQELNRRGLQLYGQPVAFELISVDDAGEPTRARAAAQALVAAGVVAVVGHLLSASSMAAAPVYAAAGIPQVSPSASISAFTHSGWPTAFRMLADDARMAAVLAHHAVGTLQLRRVAVVDDRSDWGRSIADAFAQALQGAGAQVVGRRQLQASSAAARLALVRELQALAPDALFFGGFDREAGPLLRQMRRQGLDARFIVGDGACTPDLVSYWAVGEAADDQVLCPLPAGVQGLDTPAMAGFVAAYQAQFGNLVPEFYGAYAYDAVMALADALLRAGSAAPEELLRALAQTRGYPGVTGTIGFDERGDRVAPAVSLFTYRDEQRVLLRTLR